MTVISTGEFSPMGSTFNVILPSQMGTLRESSVRSSHTCPKASYLILKRKLQREATRYSALKRAASHMGGGVKLTETCHLAGRLL